MKIRFFEKKEDGIAFAKKTLYATITRHSVLFLSGGNTPKPLYEQFTKDKKINPAAVYLIDERYGEPFHTHSNEKMIKDTGFMGYCLARDIPFYRILNGKKKKEATHEYEQLLVDLFKTKNKKIAIMGIGPDGHTAGLPAEISNLKFPIFNKSFAVSIDDFPGEHSQRITMTFEALKEIDIHVLLVFGQDKKEALQKMLKAGSVREIPARFYLRPEISKKTLLITDIKV